MKQNTNYLPLLPGLTVLFLGAFSSTTSLAAPPPALDVATIQSMKGCYEVDYKFPNFKATTTEWVTQEDDFSFQHIMLTGSPQNPVFKHFSQEWTFEPQQLLEFRGENVWEKVTLSGDVGKNYWVARSLQIDGSPRYDCIGDWAHDEGTSRNSFVCTAPAPLPTREKGRKDYTVLDRMTDVRVSATGWTEQELNRKMDTRVTPAKEVEQEEGINTYTKVDESKCELAKTWWNSNRAVWNHIGSVWKGIYEKSDRLQFKAAGPDRSPLFVSLTKLANENAAAANVEGFDSNAFKEKVAKLISDYLVQ